MSRRTVVTIWQIVCTVSIGGLNVPRLPVSFTQFYVFWLFGGTAICSMCRDYDKLTNVHTLFRCMFFGQEAFFMSAGAQSF